MTFIKYVRVYDMMYLKSWENRHVYFILVIVHNLLSVSIHLLQSTPKNAPVNLKNNIPALGPPSIPEEYYTGSRAPQYT